jgi:hypothetical protein
VIEPRRVPRVIGVRNGLPLLEDERILDVSNVVWCTGFRPDFSWIDLPVFGEDSKEPMHHRGIVADQPGLFFVGLFFAAQQRHFSRRLSFHFGRQFKSEGRGPFERFTQEAREVIVTAQQEARSLLHNYLGVEHLLLGLSADRVVGPLLGAAGASRDAILDQVRQIVGEGRDTPAGTIPFTPRAKRALEVAARAAGRSGEQIEPAHILLGVLDLREGVGAQILDVLEVSRDDLTKPRSSRRVRTESSSSLEIGEHQDVEQFGARSGAEGVQAGTELALEAVRSQLRTHEWRLRDH